MALRSLYDVAAPAKLNFFLHVIGQRADGYHLLQSLFVLIDWCDTLHFERRDDGALARHDLGEPLPADDLCLRAARALQQAGGTSLGADISIDKRVPSGAGMGGGSSDAASTLLALNRLWGLRWPRARLAELALTLGADVPFFIGGRNAFVEGIGEKLTPVAVPVQWLAVAKPPQSIATRAIFTHPLLVRDTEAVIVEGFLADTRATAVASSGSFPAERLLGTDFGRNDLQPPAEAECPEVAQAARLLRERFGNSRMSGSGSAVFARAGTLDRPVAQVPSDLPPGWVARMCRSLEQHPLAGWAED
jgi:4-diphosphocytidyl-2-C-methyl-D-erythritol kinase